MRTALTEVETAFRFLVCPPAPLSFDARPVAGLPDRVLALDELRDLLLKPGLSVDTVDAVWRVLIDRVRDGDPTWVVGAVGIAVPGLTRLAARLSHGNRKACDDIDSEVLTGFLHALRTDDATAPRVWLRLCWAAWRAGHNARQSDDHLELPPDLPAGSRTPRRPYGHPDLVLGRAVAANIITRAQAQLIGSTRLGDVLIEQIAAAQGEPGSVVRMRRKRAERKLAAAIQAGDLAFPRSGAA
jgi:hypothetical protein